MIESAGKGELDRKVFVVDVVFNEGDRLLLLWLLLLLLLLSEVIKGKKKKKKDQKKLLFFLNLKPADLFFLNLDSGYW